MASKNQRIISLEVVANAIITIGHLIKHLAKAKVTMSDLVDILSGKKSWRDLPDVNDGSADDCKPMIDTSAVNDAIEVGVVTISSMPNKDGWYLGTALCPACGLMVTADIDQRGTVKFSDHGNDGDWCRCLGYDLNSCDPRGKTTTRQGHMVEMRPCPRCHRHVYAEIRDPEDPRDREVRILAHEGCSYTGDGCAIFTTSCNSCARNVKARFDWMGNLWHDDHNVPGDYSCPTIDRSFYDPYHLEGLVDEDSFGTHLIVQDTEP